MATKRQVKLRGPTSELARYLSAPYVRMIIPNADEGSYLAEVLELPGCITEGDTPEEAYRNLEDAMAGWITASLDTNRPIPDAVGDKEYSGHFPLRMSTELHRLAALRAMQEGISLNQWIARAIAAQVARETLAEDLADQIAAKVASRMSVSVSAAFSVQIEGVPSEASTPTDFTRVEPGALESTIVTPEPVVVPSRALRQATVKAIETGKKVSQNA